jgi:YidC/Oxa1 family membrane protein insertase
MERRVLFAIVLCFMVLYVWQAIFVKPVPKPAAGSSASASTAATSSGASGTVAPGASSAAATGVAATPAPASAAPATTLVGDTAEHDVRIETDDVIAVFTNRGARLKSWRLKHFLDPQQQPQELIETHAAGQPLPFTLRTQDQQVNQTINAALYATDGPSAAGAATAVQFEYRDSAGVHVTKRFELAKTSYVATFSATVTAGDRPLPAAVVWGPALGDIGEMTRGIQAAQGLIFQDGSPLRLTASDIGKQPTHDGDFHYAGVDDNYFMAVVLSPGASKISYEPVTIPPPVGSKDAARALLTFSIEPQKSTALKFFVGPKDFGMLTAMDRDLARAVNFGRFSFIVVPLLETLKWINRFVGNWGWSIVLMTLLINAATAPIRHMQVVSMRKMQEIQPEVKAIQDRYSKLKTTDPAKQKMNQELMALYREKKVNPALGCVPVLLTLPIVLAMWALLQTSIELRGAPWFGWIHDLSAHDPYYVLPLLMMGTQFWQQLTMPSAGADPAQQKMMLFMPLVMGFIFLFLPAGALLYYVVTNIVGIGQQYATNYMIGPPKVRTVRPAAERRLKRAGSGKTEAAAKGE